MTKLDNLTESESSHQWKMRKKREARAFRDKVEAQLRNLDLLLDHSPFGLHARHELEVSFAHERGSQHWFTARLKWAVLLALLNAGIVVKVKDSNILCPGPLAGGTTDEGTRKLKSNVQALHCVITDYDKGDAPMAVLAARMEELGLESAIYPTFSHLKDATELDWDITRPNPKTGVIETVPTAFQLFVRERMGFDENLDIDPSAVTAEIAKAFMVECQDFDDHVLGEVEILDTAKPKKNVVKLQDGAKRVDEARCVVVKHNQLAKSRLVLPLAKPFLRRHGESDAAFQERWEEEAYLPIARMIGFKFDPTCASTERGHYAMTRKEGTKFTPLHHVTGCLIDLDDPKIKALIGPHLTMTNEEHAKKRKPRSRRHNGRYQRESTSGDGQRDWLGFQAADAAADLLPSMTDKRSDAKNPLVAFCCPFVHEHATTNDPSAHQCYAYNASSSNKLPTVKCMSATCQDRPYGDFLDALFDDEVKVNPAYRLAASSERTGVYIPRDDLEDKLHEINETWAVVRIGNRTRYLHENAEGDIELYDGKSIHAWFSNWSYYWIDQGGNAHAALILPAWLQWQYRRQYRGVRFCPEPEGAPKDIFNTYFGFSVEPKKGSWKRLLGHIYRNVCRRDAEYFRFFIAWLAQLVQQPHIKPGTNIVLKGKEGVGKSKVGEWIVALFDRNAIVVSEAERITGRFNGHLENKLFLMAEEAFWAGDKAAEGKLKDLGTGTNMSYERKGLDAYEGRNFTRVMIASNEDWVVPASSGGRRWFVVEVGNDHEKDYAYFAAIDEEMESGGLAAMLYDLQNTRLPELVNVRSAPVTPWLVQQRLHSYDNKKRWWRGVLQEGGFRLNATENFVVLEEDRPTAVKREDIFASAKQYFTGPKGVDPTPSDVGQFVAKMLGELQETRPRIEGHRYRCTIFPSLKEMRERWFKDTGEMITSPGAPNSSEAPSHASSSARHATNEGVKVSVSPEPGDFRDDNPMDEAVKQAWEDGEKDLDQLAAVADAAADALNDKPLPICLRPGAAYH